MSLKNCRACGSPNTRPRFAVSENLVRICVQCSHVYLDILHDADSIRRLYENYGDHGQTQYFSGIDKEVTRHLDSYLGRCKKFLQTTDLDRKLFDIGCGSGALIGRAKQLGFLCSGIEICSPMAQRVRNELDCEVYEQFLSELRLPDSCFDVVTMYDLIEHLENPYADLKQVFRMIKSGGIFFALTPNDQSLPRRISRALYTLSFHKMKSPLRKLYYPDHLSYFTRESLTLLLQRVGFELISLESVNQELARLQLSRTEQLLVKAIFKLSMPLKHSRGKLVVFARKP